MVSTHFYEAFKEDTKNKGQEFVDNLRDPNKKFHYKFRSALTDSHNAVWQLIRSVRNISATAAAGGSNISMTRSPY